MTNCNNHIYQKISSIILLILVIFFVACSHKKDRPKKTSPHSRKADTVIVDCQYTFEEATEGSKAPRDIIMQLELIDVKYISTDKKLHQGQILTNKRMSATIRKMFTIMLTHKFPVASAIPVVKFENNDDLSMEANNTYSFCYRNTSYSKHSIGMAIDINPFFNPVRWKPGTPYRMQKPAHAVYQTDVNGTFYPDHPIVIAFKKLGLKWGHNFSTKFDDHHFELRGRLPYRNLLKKVVTESPTDSITTS